MYIVNVWCILEPWFQIYNRNFYKRWQTSLVLWGWGWGVKLDSLKVFRHD